MRATLPAEGNVLLVASIRLRITFQESRMMYDTDFQLAWGEEDDAYAYPVTTDMETFEELDPVGENQLPGTYPWRSMRSAAGSCSTRFRPVTRISRSLPGDV